VLELLIQDEDAEPRKTAAYPAGNSMPASSDDEQAAQIPKTLVSTRLIGVNGPSAEFCDNVLLSKVDESDAIDKKSLRCIELIVPKDQVLGYSTASWRNYRGKYTAYLPGLPKDPTIVKWMDSKPGITSATKAVSIISNSH